MLFRTGATIGATNVRFRADVFIRLVAPKTPPSPTPTPQITTQEALDTLLVWR